MDRAGPFQALEHRFEFLSDLPGAVGLVERLFAPFEDGGEGGQPTVYELRRSDAGPTVRDLVRWGSARYGDRRR